MTKKTTLVYVKPIIKEKWHGLDKLGRAKFQGTYDTIMALYDPNLGRLATGLEPEDEKRLGQSLGTDLTSSSQNEYWEDFKIKLEDKTMIFDTVKPIDELQVKMMKASNMVANSQKEYSEGKWPTAKYVIYDEKDEVEAEAKEIEKEAQAMQIFTKLTHQKRCDLLKVFGKAAIGITEDFSYTNLYKVMNDNPTKFIKVASEKPENIKVKALVFDLEHKGIFRRKGTAYLYNDQQVGFDFEDTVLNLLNPKQQEMLVKLKGDLEARS